MDREYKEGKFYKPKEVLEDFRDSGIKLVRKHGTYRIFRDKEESNQRYLFMATSSELYWLWKIIEKEELKGF